jgi:hypothetical protein
MRASAIPKWAERPQLLNYLQATLPCRELLED